MDELLAGSELAQIKAGDVVEGVEVWCQRIWTGYGTFGDHDHVLLSYEVWASVRNLGS